MGALWNCDRLTFEAIQQASFSIMSDLLFENGHFIDADGETWQSPSEIQLGLHESDSPYLPLGVAGLREAIAKALDEIADKKTCRERERSLIRLSWRKLSILSGRNT